MSHSSIFEKTYQYYNDKLRAIANSAENIRIQVHNCFEFSSESTYRADCECPKISKISSFRYIYPLGIRCAVKVKRTSYLGPSDEN